MNTTVNATANTTQPSVIERFGIKLGTGACSVLNTVRDMTYVYDDYYDKKEDKNILDKAMKGMSTLGHVGSSIVKNVGQAGVNIIKSEPVQNMKKSISNAYTNMRTKYVDHLFDNYDKIKTDRESGKTGFGQGFKEFFNTSLLCVEYAYSKGENFVKNLGKSHETVKENIKGSSAYQKLISERDKADNIEKTDIEKTELERT